MIYRSLLICLAVVFSAASGQAMTTTFGGAGDPSLHGTTGSLTVTEAGAAGNYDVAWSMDFEGFEGSVGNHQFLTHVAFKAFTSISAVTLDSIDWTSATGIVESDDLLYSSNVNNGGCDAGSNAGFVCATLNPPVDATMDGVFTANFSVMGDVDLSGWSYRGKFGSENGWVISESSNPVPEPSAALVFGLGIAMVGWRARKNA